MFANHSFAAVVAVLNLFVKSCSQVFAKQIFDSVLTIVFRILLSICHQVSYIWFDNMQTKQKLVHSLFRTVLDFKLWIQQRNCSNSLAQFESFWHFSDSILLSSISLFCATTKPAFRDTTFTLLNIRNTFCTKLIFVAWKFFLTPLA